MRYRISAGARPGTTCAPRVGGAQIDCPTDATGLNFRGGCDCIDEYEMGYNDATGYNDLGPLDVNTGCTGGHNECPTCTFESAQEVSPRSPEFRVDTLGEDLYWDYYVIDHTTSECSTDCYQDSNPTEYGGAFGNFGYQCYQ